MIAVRPLQFIKLNTVVDDTITSETLYGFGRYLTPERNIQIYRDSATSWRAYPTFDMRIHYPNEHEHFMETGITHATFPSRRALVEALEHLMEEIACK